MHADLNFFLVPKLVEFKPNQQFNTGQKFKLFCYLYEGSRPITFEWFKNGLILSTNISNSRFRIDTSEDESHFTIDRLQNDDSGTYSCSAQNNLGFDRQSTLLLVKGWKH